MRIAIAGGPRTGKTTLAVKVAQLLGVTARATDSLVGKLDWSAASLEVSKWFDEPGPWVIEGVSVPRAIRKWLAAHPTGWPFDVVVWRDRPFEVTAPGQVTMAKGCLTVWDQVRPELVARGVMLVVAEGASDEDLLLSIAALVDLHKRGG